MTDVIQLFKKGTTQRKRVTLDPGTYPAEDDSGVQAIVTVSQQITVDRVEILDHCSYDKAKLLWQHHHYDWKTAVAVPPPPPVPTLWERFKAWLMTPLGAAPLPKARQLLPTKIWRDPLPEEVDPNADL